MIIQSETVGQCVIADGHDPVVIVDRGVLVVVTAYNRQVADVRGLHPERTGSPARNSPPSCHAEVRAACLTPSPQRRRTAPSRGQSTTSATAAHALAAPNVSHC